MILCHSRRFVFIKTRKTGSTSVEIALSRIADDRDVLTPITPIDEYLRVIDGRPCQNYSGDRHAERQWAVLVERTRGKVAFPDDVKRRAGYYNHMPLREVLDRADAEVAGYFRFTVERHPYEKAVSLANFLPRAREYRSGGALTSSGDDLVGAVSRLITSGRLRRIRNFDLYTLGGALAVNRVIRYENLEQELRDAMRDLGIEPAPVLPRTKVGERDKTVPASEILTPDQKAYVRELCREEFERFGYAP